tara:strand:- start:64 stop:1860 length:1797 start_codon:yes stop_codon:yes gene_type:complete
VITLKKLQWSNCFSYGPDNEIDLDDTTVTQIVGTNGMGKSSIPLIIEEALYNKNSKGIKKADIPNRYINDGYSIILSFTKDKDEYTIDITRKSGIKVKLLKNGEDISSHTATNTYKSIQELIGVDFKTFSQIVYQNTNASLQFLTATDTNRKKFLIDLLHLDNYVALFETFKASAKTSALQIAKLTGEVEMVEKWLASNDLKDTTILPMINLEIETEDDEEDLRSLSVELLNISEKNKKISTNNTYKDLLSKINIDEIQRLPPIQRESYDTLQAEVGALRGTQSFLKKEIDKLEATPDVCSSCGQKIPKDSFTDLLASYAKDLVNTQIKLNSTTELVQEIKANNRELDRREKLEAEWRELYRSVDNSLPSETIEKEDLQKQISEVSLRIKEAKEKIDEITKENERRTLSNNRISIIQAQRDSFLEKLNNAQERLSEVETLNSNLEVLKKAFSTNGLIAYKIENLVKELEELTNTYLAELSDGRFTLQFIVVNDKLNVQVTDNENVVDILALSSGELARVNTATLLAIRKLMSSISKSRLNVLFLDEVTNVLDDAGREKLVEVLLKEELNTYVVSHGWTHPLLEKVEVVKHGNVSSLDR